MKPLKQMYTNARSLNEEIRQQARGERCLNAEEVCELISALAIAAQNNRKKSKNFKSAAAEALHVQDRADLDATAERFDMWAKLDESLIEAIREGRLIIIGDTEDINEEDTED